MKYESRTTRVSIIPKGEPIFSQHGYHIEIDDEAAGEFVSVKYEDQGAKDGMEIDPEVWPILRETIDAMFADIKQREESL
jgi:hypothetical protein